MLGPASAHPVGTPEWAECLGNELDYMIERANDHGVEGLVPLIRVAITASTPPWKVWPRPPCDTPDTYFELCTGLNYKQLWEFINTLKEDHGLARSLDVVRETNARGAGRPRKDRNIPYDVRNISTDGQDGGNSRSYLLRRIGIKAPEILAAWERGEYKSVRAAADAAGIPRLTKTSILRSAWKKASAEERAEFIRMIEESEK